MKHNIELMTFCVDYPFWNTLFQYGNWQHCPLKEIDLLNIQEIFNIKTLDITFLKGNKHLLREFHNQQLAHLLLHCMFCDIDNCKQWKYSL